MAPTREQKLQRQWRKLADDSYNNFCAGATTLLGQDPRGARAGSAQIKSAFRSSYTILQWCRSIRRVGKARLFLIEVHSTLPIAISTASIGLYPQAFSQIRYVYECVLSFLYFRDHPRELELAHADSDLWDATRPSAVTSLLRRLPEFDNNPGRDAFSLGTQLYGDLCGYIHPSSLSDFRRKSFVFNNGPFQPETVNTVI